MNDATRERMKAARDRRVEAEAEAERVYNGKLLDAREEMREAGLEYDRTLKRIADDFKRERDDILATSANQ